MVFPVSGVEVSPLLPFFTALIISFFTSMAGVSGAFLLLPFQVSVLGFASPAVSPTNLVFNIVAIPSGVYRYIKEGRMAWPLAWVIVLGTLPGIFIGALLRIKYLPDPKHFKLFVGFVLLYLSFRLFSEITGRARKVREKNNDLQERFRRNLDEMHKDKGARKPEEGAVRTVNFSLTNYAYAFYGETFSFHTMHLVLLTFVVGIIGGAYGIGGGAIIAPFLIAFFGLPVYTIAGATLFATFLTSIAGVVFYSMIAPLYAHTGLAVAPDLALGALFGFGGMIGMYLGARFQKFMPARAIKLLLGISIFFLALTYITAYFR